MTIEWQNERAAWQRFKELVVRQYRDDRARRGGSGYEYIEPSAAARTAGAEWMVSYRARRARPVAERLIRGVRARGVLQAAE